MPKKVYIKPSAKGLGARRAVKAMNAKVSGKAFKVVGQKSKADVVVKKGNPGKGYAGRATTDASGKSRIRLRQVTKGQSRAAKKSEQRLAAHELGHAAGLGHTKGKKNLMNPSAGGQRLTKGQKRKLR